MKANDLVYGTGLRGKPCPKCGKKTMRVANHPHAFGYKDTTRVNCWSCHGTFNAEKYAQWLNSQAKDTQ